MALTNGTIPSLSWKGLIQDGFAHGVKKGRLTAAQAEAWKTQLDSTDLDDLLAAAEFVGRKLEAPRGDLYARWLENVFSHVRPTNHTMGSAILGLVSAGVPLCTLNYDPLLERVTGLPSINIGETGKVAAWMRREIQGILHLHGSWDLPESCILGIRDYETTLGNDVRDLIQRNLASFQRLLFIGCGNTFADPNFSALIRWLREKMKTAAPQHYALVSDGEMAERHADVTWHGFVEPISYGEHHADLAPFITAHFTTPKATKTKKSGLPKAPGSSSEHERLLRDYRAFLLKDCGQMTIEGVRADMDTAQRRFDLERLFVPLDVVPSPPDISESDPQREEKLRRWREKNAKPREFGSVFGKHSRLALLALPGGGKTLLLKRLAVAYADPARRQASADGLPDMDLTPVLIRCREWREHIHRPILTLLRSLPDITGHASLSGLAEALLPLFKKGRVLLLVDGLDEIHDDALRCTFVDHLESFIDEYKRTRLVVTSREAGFNLVAPALARFCQRWRVAPLAEDAITALCDHWHRLMSGDSPESVAEAREVAEHLLRNDSLHRLAETPLLLTMLLVVKHGAGRLPPDRVSLYSRAVEVLLDTWNIKGHAPLNPKEAVPQLAYVAFELMRAGQQTATERELLSLLEEARESVPHIRRYAKDHPDAFLKRVELRSSLLIEAGYQVENNQAVPFYQFRHLTFQEYLSGVAIVEGHYKGYERSDTVLAPLASRLSAEEWKEVIPMAAVLARKQAEPLIAALVDEGTKLRQLVEVGGEHDLLEDFADVMPLPISLLIQCLVEEAEPTPETLTSALQLIAFFAQGCESEHGWDALMRGPYGAELLHQVWLLYRSMQWPEDTWVYSSFAEMSFRRHTIAFWLSTEGQAKLQGMLSSNDVEEVTRGLFTWVGLYMHRWENLYEVEWALPLQAIVETHLFQEDVAVSSAAAWAWALPRYRDERLAWSADPTVLNRLTGLWLGSFHPLVTRMAAFALSTAYGMQRDAWAPVLTDQQIKIVRERKKVTDLRTPFAVTLVAFHAKSIFSEEELARRIASIPRLRMATKLHRDSTVTMLEQMGRVGKKYLKQRKQ
ncbi:MAG: SIR2 family protein [Gemmatimonadota bacterium]